MRRYGFILLFIPIVAAGAAGAGGGPTFAGNVAPIVYAKCAMCHRPGEAAPFALLSYDDVRKKGRQIAKVTAARYMPPWHARHGYGEFADERRLTDEEIDTIAQWVKGGMPEGDLSLIHI